jgi:amino acid adenylation domain-containing protein
MKQIDKSEIEDIVSLTPMQEGMLFHYLKEPSSDLYFEQLSLMLEGDIDRSIFEQSWAAVIDANEMLRTVFRWQKVKEPVQVVLKEAAFKRRYVDLTHPGPSLAEIKDRDRQERFDLQQPAFRVTLVTLADQEYELIISSHHILYDGWSTGIILREFLQAYDDLRQNRPLIKPRKHRFKEFVQWRRKQAAEAEEPFWQHYLAGFDPGTGFFSQREPDSPGATERYQARLPQALTRRLREFVRRHKITPAVLLYSAFGLLLQRYGDCHEVVFGTTVSGRPPQLAGIEETVGLFINTLPLRVQGEAANSTEELVQAVQQGLQSRKPFEYSSLPDIKRFAGIDGTGELFHSMVAIENYPLERQLMQVNGSLSIGSYTIAETTHYALTLTVSLFDDIAFTFLYDPAVLDTEVVFAMAAHFQTILRELTEHPAKTVGEIDILSTQEKETILYRFNDTESPYPTGQTIVQLFEAQVESAPNHIALVGEDRQVTYAELNRRAEQLADRLYLEGVLADTVVGVRLERSIEMVVGVLAVLKAGAAYLPIDPDTPEERVTYMLRESGSRFVLDDSVLDQLQGSPAAQACPRKPGSLAYCIYTSGTSGRPKGVLVEQAAVIRLVKETNYIDFRPDDRLLQTGALAFDASTFEIWGALLNGLTLYLVQKEKILAAPLLKQITQKYNITIMWLTASLFNQLLDADIDIFGGLRYLLAGGEALSPPHINRLRKKYPALNIVNGYGPTENTTFSTTHLIRQEHRQNIPIGRPIAHSTAYVVDRQGRLQPVGAVGELWLGGRGLARGYLNNPDLTAEKFINLAAKGREDTRSSKDEILTPKSQPLYKTGDLCRFQPDGNIEFMGRIDHQVKIRGFRIELAEIESQLVKHEAVTEAVVTVRSDDLGDKILVAYIVSPPTSKTNRTSRTNKTSPAKLRQYLAEILPDYMIPSYFVSLDRIPLTPNGKIDRRALPEPSYTAEKTYKAPANEIEGKLVEIWSQILSIDKDRIGTDVSFFELGGHSLKATRLVSHIHRHFDVQISLAEFFKRPTIQWISENIDRLASQRYVPIPVVEKRDFYAVSPAQRRLYILQQMNEADTGYNMPAVLVLVGEIDRDQLEQTFKKLLARHEILRTCFGLEKGEPVQRVHQYEDFAIEYWGEVEESQIPAVIAGFVQPFDLSHPPLLRVGLLKAGERAYRLLVDMHHIISDGISIGLLVEEFLALYEGRRLSPSRVQYRDYARWQNRQGETDSFKRQEQYWLRQFADDIPVLDLPVDGSLSNGSERPGCALEFRLPAQEVEGLNRLAAAEGVTLYMLLLAFYGILLFKLTGQEDIVIGTPVAGRRHVDAESLLGVFINTLALRVQVPIECPFRECLRAIKGDVVQAFENQDYPFEELVEKVVVERDVERNPLFDVMFVLQNFDRQEIRIPGLQVSLHHYIDKSPKFYLTLNCQEAGSELFFSFQFSPALFRSDTVHRFIDYFKRIVSDLLTDPGENISALNILSESERDQLLTVFNDTDQPYSADRTIDRLFAEQAEKTAHRVAVIGDHGSSALTYSGLNYRADRLARFLRTSKGIERNDFAAIMVEPLPHMAVGIMGILKAGAAYLPVDPEHPGDRIRHMLSDSRAGLILLHRGMEEKVGDQVDILYFDDDTVYSQQQAPMTDEDRPQAHRPEDPVYAIYTSGTSGQSKGVVLMHGNLVQYVSWFCRAVQLDSRDKTVLTSSFAFDLGYTSIYPALLTGCQLHLVSRDTILSAESLLDYIGLQGISYIKVTPSLFGVLVESSCFTKKRLSRLRWVVLGGEAIKPEDVERAHQRCDHLRFINHYGPTETTIGSIARFIDFDDFEEYAVRPTIGTPISNTRIFITDRALNPVPIGVSGEIAIAGLGVGRGYLNQPELTAKKFVKLAVSTSPQPLNPKSYILYRTGDLGRFMVDGNIEFLGRVDQQVKIRGYRIELAEIEAQLQAHPTVKEAVITIHTENRGDKTICAYFVPHPPTPTSQTSRTNETSRTNRTNRTNETSPLKLREYLSRTLPEYMIPTYFVPLEKIPLTPNGKLDRRALPQPDTVDGTGTYEAPRHDMDRRQLDIWSDLLAKEPGQIGIDTNFFEMGGHSLKAVNLLSRLHQAYDVRVPLAEFFKRPTIRGLSDYIERADRQAHRFIGSTEEKEYYPLSPAQKRMFVMQQMDENAVSYNMPVVFDVEGHLDRARLEKSFQRLIRRHESFRTGFDIVERQPVQRIYRQVDFALEYYGKEGIDREFVRAFHLSRPPLLRVGLIRTDDTHHTLMVDMHHIIADGTSRAILVREFMALYAGESVPVNRLQYRDYAQWQYSRFLCRQEALNRQAGFWQRQFSGEVPELNLPTDFPRPLVPGFKGDALYFTFGPIDTGKLRRLALQSQATLYMVLLAIFNILLSKLSGQTDIVVGTVTEGRQHRDVESMIGMFVNTLALRSFPHGDKTFGRFLSEVGDNAVSGFENQDYPFEELVRLFSDKRVSGRNPLFDVMFVLENQEVSEFAIPGLKLKRHPYEGESAKFDLLLTGTEESETDGLSFKLEYNTGIFTRNTAIRFGKFFERIATAVRDCPEIEIARIQIMDEAERNRVLHEWNATHAAYPEDKTIPELFEYQATRTPGHIALVLAENQFTYRQLNIRANRLANTLRLEGVKNNSIAAIMAGRSIEMMVGLMAVLKAGGAYLPVDAEYPERRIKYMLRDSGARILLSQPDLSGRLEFDGVTLYIDEGGAYRGGEDNLDAAGIPGNAAYVIYTSGSTGRPRGVLIEHSSVVNLAYCQMRRFKIDNRERVLQFSSICFDASVEQITISLFSGAVLVLIDRERLMDMDRFVEYLIKQQVTHVHAVPSFLNTLKIEGQDITSLRRVISGGDECSVELAGKWGHDCTFYNEYGPTETTVTSIEWKGEALSDSAIRLPIGRALDNTTVYIFDRWLKPVPPGVNGELYIGGDGLGRGYLNNPELTAHRFINVAAKSREGIQSPKDEILTPKSQPLYRTGDLCRFLPDGNIEFLGRLDHQVKIRGFRIELAEIESRLRDHPAVGQAVVTAHADQTGDKAICAYIVPNQTNQNSRTNRTNETSPLKLREYLSRTLPDYMLPAYFVQLQEIPLTSSGKVDKKRLPAPDVRVGDEYEAPVGEIEKSLVKIWSDVLSLQEADIGVNSSFFELGGHSLKAIKLIADIERRFKKKVPLAEIFKNRTVKALSGYIGSASAGQYISVKPVEEKDYYPLSAAQRRLYVLQQMDEQGIAYNVPTNVLLQGQVDESRLAEAFCRLIRRHESLRTSFVLYDKEPVQRVHRQVDFTIKHGDFNGDDIIGRFIQAFDLTEAPLLRVWLIKFAEKTCIMLVDIHHIISDEVSGRVLIKEFISLYTRQQLSSLKLRYRDFCNWQEQLFRSQEIRRQESYWLARYSGPVPQLALPLDYPRASSRSNDGAVVEFALEDRVTAELRRLVQERGTTTYILLLAAFNTLLFRYTGAEDIVIATPIVGRNHADFDRIIGMFVNMLAMRNRPAPDKTFREFLDEVKINVLEAFDNQDYQFDELIRKLNARDDANRELLSEVVFDYKNIDERLELGQQTELPGLTLTPQEFTQKAAKFDLLLNAYDSVSGLRFRFTYRCALFKRQTIEKMGQHLESIIEVVVQNPDLPISDIELLRGPGAGQYDQPGVENIAASFDL